MQAQAQAQAKAKAKAQAQAQAQARMQAQVQAQANAQVQANAQANAPQMQAQVRAQPQALAESLTAENSRKAERKLLMWLLPPPCSVRKHWEAICLMQQQRALRSWRQQGRPSLASLQLMPGRRPLVGSGSRQSLLRPQKTTALNR